MPSHPAFAGASRYVTFLETESLVDLFFQLFGSGLFVVGLFVGCYELGYWYGGRK